MSNSVIASSIYWEWPLFESSIQILEDEVYCSRVASDYMHTLQFFGNYKFSVPSNLRGKILEEYTKY